MGRNKKPLKKYRPRATIGDPIRYVLSGFARVADNNGEAVTLRIRNHGALAALVNGQGGQDDAAILLGAVDIGLSLVDRDIGGEYLDDLVDAYVALRALAWRGHTTGRYIFRAPELRAVQYAMEIHDAQLDVATVKDIETAVACCQIFARAGRIHPHVESRDRRATKETA